MAGVQFRSIFIFLRFGCRVSMQFGAFFYEFRSISMQFVSVDLAVGFLCSSETFVEKAFALEFVLFIDAH